MSKQFIILCCLFLAVLTNAQQAETEQLLIFVQTDQQSEFTNKNIDSLQSFMEAQKIPVKRIEIGKQGVVAEAGFTPFIVYQNHLGRRIYKGRYSTYHRMLNFIRTSRFLPPAKSDYEKKGVWVWQNEKASIVANIKVTELSGKELLTSEKAKERYTEQIKEGLAKGFSNFEFKETFAIGSQSKQFHLNFYPFASEDGKLWISYHLYSNYDCINPIFDYTEAASSPFKRSDKAFAAAAKALQEAIIDKMNNSELGDAFSPIANSQKSKSWEDLGLPLPLPPKNVKKMVTTALKLPLAWEYSGPANEGVPALQFSFPAPLTQYSGEVKDITGLIEVKGEKEGFKDAQGSFDVDVKSLTMGLTDLNDAVLEKILYVDKHPTASFSLTKVEGQDLGLTWGKITQASIVGTFQLLGKKSETTARAQIEPILSAEGEPRLHIRAQFEVNQLREIFNIETPSGPKEANNRMLFNVNLLMQPKK